jgi:16S rRNA (guanine1207-N2)-methyltransferase
MDAKSQVILRQSNSWPRGVLLVNPPQDQLSLALPDSQIWTWNYADHQFFLAQNYVTHFDTVPPAGRFAQVMIFVPKAKAQLQYVLAQCAALLASGQQIWLVGEKKAGIEGSAKLLAAYGPSHKLDSARHCQLWQVSVQQHYAAPVLSDWIQRYTLQFAGRELTICALPGVFSQQRLDQGTAELLPYLAEVCSGEILDFGCGAGVIAVALAQKNQKNTITAADIDAFALQSTILTFAENGLSAQLKTLAIRDIQEINTDFAAIVSNPPFHQGIHTHYQASENLCHMACDRLQIGGELWIVANRFLNYSPLIEKRFGNCQLKADHNGFKVLFAKK